MRRLLWKPGELGLARAWVAGELDIEGDLYETLDLMAGLLWERGADAKDAVHPIRDPKVRAAARGLLQLAGPWPPPPPPAEEVRRRTGPLHTRRRDKEAISHHYDVGNDFYELVLGPSMVYSCAYWEDDGSLEDAQRDKLDLVCRKLALKEGDRLLDVGCGWGSMAIHAAREYGAQVTGVTLSTEQAAYARKRIAEEGLTDRIEIRVQDYRDVRDGPYDAISSIGMAEHVGSVRYREYADDLYALLKPGGRLLNHQIARRPERDESAYHVDEFIDAYVFPDGELAPVGRTVAPLEEAGFEARDVESIREHYALTLRRWVANLEQHWDRAVAPDLARPGQGLAPVHGGLRPLLRAQQDRRQPDPRGASDGGRGLPHAAARPRLEGLRGRLNASAGGRGPVPAAPAAGYQPSVPAIAAASLRLDRRQHVQLRGAAGRPQRGQHAHQRRRAPGRPRSGPTGSTRT